MKVAKTTRAAKKASRVAKDIDGERKSGGFRSYKGITTGETQVLLQVGVVKAYPFPFELNMEGPMKACRVRVAMDEMSWTNMASPKNNKSNYT
jgi:hypothetical protein